MKNTFRRVLSMILCIYLFSGAVPMEVTTTAMSHHHPTTRSPRRTRHWIPATPRIFKIPISWGGSGDEADRIVFANGAFCGSPIHRVTFSGKTAFCIEWNGKVPEDGEGELRIEVTSKTDTKTDVVNEKTYEYSDAIGQIIVRKHDQDGMSLDGALL